MLDLLQGLDGRSPVSAKPGQRGPLCVEERSVDPSLLLERVHPRATLVLAQSGSARAGPALVELTQPRQRSLRDLAGLRDCVQP